MLAKVYGRNAGCRGVWRVEADSDSGSSSTSWRPGLEMSELHVQTHVCDLFDRKKIPNYIRKYRVKCSKNTLGELGVAVISEDIW